MQIRNRLTLLFLLIAAVVLAAVLGGVYWMYQNYRTDNFYESLALQAQLASDAALKDTRFLRVLPKVWPVPEGDSLPYQDNVSIYNESYERVLSLHTDAVPVSTKALQEVFKNGRYRFEHFNLHALGMLCIGPENKPYVVVAEKYFNPSEFTAVGEMLLWSYFFGITLMAVSGWYFSGQALRPVSRIMNEVDELSPSMPEKRIATGTNQDELSRLADTFNRLLDRVEQAFRMQRMFLSNVSHELRNPLTAVRMQLDVSLQRDRTPQEYRQALQSVLDDVRAISNVEEKLLQLARIYNDPNAVVLSPLRLDELVLLAAAQLQKSHSMYKIAIDFQNMPETPEKMNVQANEALLYTALLNLMDNGCKYSPDNRVLVSIQFDEHGAHTVRFFNRGDGIAPEEQHLIFEPFYRSERHRQIKGTGIGLPLVKSILDVHQSRLAVESSDAGEVVFTIRFPRLYEA